MILVSGGILRNMIDVRIVEYTKMKSRWHTILAQNFREESPVYVDYVLNMMRPSSLTDHECTFLITATQCHSVTQTEGCTTASYILSFHDSIDSMHDLPSAEEPELSKASRE